MSYLGAYNIHGHVLDTSNPHNTSINLLSDVTITAIGAGEVLTWDGAGWINQTPTEAGFSPVTHTHVEADITDLDKYTQAEVDSLLAGLASAMDDLTDVTITTAAAGEILKWSGTAWINNTLAEAGISAVGHTHLIADITDFTDNSTNWDTAFGWGDHAAGGYLLNLVEDLTPQLGGPLDLNAQNITDTTSTDISLSKTGAGSLTISSAGGGLFLQTASGDGNVAISAHGTGLVTIDGATIDSTLIGQWNTAYTWGDHAGAGYLTSITEANIESALTGALAFTVNNYVFDVDQGVGAGQDGYVLTYDNAAGEITLKESTGGTGTGFLLIGA